MVLNNLERERKRLKMSQFQLSVKTGIHPTDISKIEHGIVKPFPSWKKRLSEALNAPEDKLFPEAM